jgi:hypothetical protein
MLPIAKVSAMAALALVFVTFAPLRGAGEEWTATDGKTYKNIYPVWHDDTNVEIFWKGGWGMMIPLANLPPALQKRFGYDPVRTPLLKEIKNLKVSLRESNSLICIILLIILSRFLSQRNKQGRVAL